jgi:hypothetical protein
MAKATASGPLSAAMRRIPVAVSASAAASCSGTIGAPPCGVPIVRDLAARRSNRTDKSRLLAAPTLPPSRRARVRAREAVGNQRPWPADKVERWSIDRLIPYAKNARTHTDAQVAAIAASIKEWGWTTPALVGEDGGLIAGHARILAARQLGIAEIPVMVAAGWSEDFLQANTSPPSTRARARTVRRHHTDGGGDSDHVFALLALLGFQFAPRIPDLKNRRLYSCAKPSAYPALEPLIAGRVNVALIRAHWPEILRIAASIRTGTVTASLIMRQLAAYPRQNSVAAALRELGRLERTLFTLDWIEDPGAIDRLIPYAKNARTHTDAPGRRDRREHQGVGLDDAGAGGRGRRPDRRPRQDTRRPAARHRRNPRDGRCGLERGLSTRVIGWAFLPCIVALGLIGFVWAARICWPSGPRG